MQIIIPSWHMYILLLSEKIGFIDNTFQSHYRIPIRTSRKRLRFNFINIECCSLEVPLATRTKKSVGANTGRRSYVLVLLKGGFAAAADKYQRNHQTCNLLTHLCHFYDGKFQLQIIGKQFNGEVV